MDFATAVVVAEVVVEARQWTGVGAEDFGYLDRVNGAVKVLVGLGPASSAWLATRKRQSLGGVTFSPGVYGRSSTSLGQHLGEVLEYLESW